MSQSDSVLARSTPGVGTEKSRQPVQPTEYTTINPFSKKSTRAPSRAADLLSRDRVTGRGGRRGESQGIGSSFNGRTRTRNISTSGRKRDPSRGEFALTLQDSVNCIIEKMEKKPR
jgi:hypothetical protein